MIDVRAVNEMQRAWADKNAGQIHEKRRLRMQLVDGMAPELRELVYEYGLNVVKAFTDIGVKKPRHIKHLVETVLDEFSPTRRSSSHQGVSHPREWAEL